MFWDNLRFDVEFLRICTRVPSPIASFHYAFGIQLGFAGADLTLPRARRLVSAIRAAGGSVLIVPTAYRTPVVPIMAARRIAEQHLEILRLQCGGSFGPLHDGEAHSMWWRFYADHWSPPCDDSEPELVCIDVDKVDSHIATLTDERQLAEWQQDIPLRWPAAPDEPPPPQPTLIAPCGTATRRSPNPASRPAPPRRALSLVRTDPR